MAKPITIDAYIATFPMDVQAKLQPLRATVSDAAPDATGVKATEYLPLGRTVCWFGLVSGYKSAKGPVQFPPDKPVPLELIAKIIKFRVAENLQKTKKK